LGNALVIVASIYLFGTSRVLSIPNANSAPSLAPIQIKAAIIKHDLTIGVAEGDDNYMFGHSIAFNVDDLGNIYVTDWDSKQIRKFGSDGKHILTFGRAGQGPGEFQNPGVVRFTRDGNLYISENFGNKIMFFDSNGVYKGQTNLPTDIYDIWITPAGTYLGTQQISPQYVGQGDIETSVALFSGSFQPILELFKQSFSFPDKALSQAQAHAEITSELLARPAAIAVMGEEGQVYFGRNDKYAIGVYTPDGTKLFTIARDVDPTKYEKDDKDYLLKEFAENMVSLTKSGTLVKEYLRSIRFPRFKPFFQALVPIDEGRLAVVVEAKANESSLLDLFDHAGRYMGHVEANLPPANLIIKKGKAYSIVKDESNFLYIKRYVCEIK
jgi:hypothetical protein